MNSHAHKPLAPSTPVDCPKHSPLNAKILALKTELGLMKPQDLTDAQYELSVCLEMYFNDLE